MHVQMDGWEDGSLHTKMDVWIDGSIYLFLDTSCYLCMSAADTEFHLIRSQPENERTSLFLFDMVSTIIFLF